jgi:hypothetical protein
MNFAKLGVLVVPPYQFHEDGVFSLSFGEADARLLFFLTYFQRVAVAPLNVPLGSMGVMTSTELEQTLAHQQLVRPVMFQRLQGGSMGAAMVTAFTVPLYERLNNEEPGYWAYAPAPSAADYLAQDGNPVLMLSLERCLPAPRPDVPANEVLAFRNEHALELERFHHHLDKATATITATSDVRAATRIVETDLALSIEEIAQAFQKAKIPRGLVSMSLSFSVPGQMISGALEVAVQAVGGPPTLGTLLGGMISVGLKRSRVPHGGNQWPRAFEYIASGFREGMLAADPESERFFVPNINRLEFRNNQVTLGYPEKILPPHGRSGALVGTLMA